MRTADRLAAWKARWGIARMRYAVEPGLYAVGQPAADSPVLVSANYKMSFDRLRRALAGLDAWILVLDTRGINVWCAAGKGTFGTDELVQRIDVTQLAAMLSNRTLIVPQLGAPGVAAHEVKRRSGFRVVYGPVRADDLAAFLAAGLKATPEMRRVRFPLGERLAVAPVELVMSAKWMLGLAVVLLLLAPLGPDGYSPGRLAGAGVASAGLILATWLGAVVLVPALLPWLPGRALAAKGATVGVGLAIVFGLAAARLGCVAFSQTASTTTLVGWALMITTVSSFLAMNFTGTTTYTSLSGVRREMRLAVPAQIVAGAAGIVLWMAGRFV